MRHRNLIRTVPLAALAAAITVEIQGADLVRCLTEAVADVEMTSTVPGTVAAIYFDEGSFVEQGTVIVELEAASEELDIRRRSVLVANLKSTLERSEMLLKNTSSISMEEVDKARSEYEIALIELDLAREALDKKHLKAPISGTITLLPVEVGEYCEPPQPLMRIVDTRQFHCVANIDPALAAGLKVGDPVGFLPELSRDAGDASLSGEIVFISPVVDSASGLLRIKALFANPASRVRPGESGLLKLPQEN